jgi:hypothetical protein
MTIDVELAYTKNQENKYKISEKPGSGRKRHHCRAGPMWLLQVIFFFSNAFIQVRI